jgi:hypothetical protein
MPTISVSFGHKTYEVTLSSVDTDHKVKVVGGQTLQSGTNNWLRAIRAAIRVIGEKR